MLKGECEWRQLVKVKQERDVKNNAIITSHSSNTQELEDQFKCSALWDTLFHTAELQTVICYIDFT